MKALSSALSNAKDWDGHRKRRFKNKIIISENEAGSSD